MVFRETTKTVSSGFLGNFYNIIMWSVRNWYIVIGTIFLSMAIIMGIKDSYVKNDIGEFVTQVGGRIMSPDSVILLEVDRLKENPKITIEGNREFHSFWEKLKFKFGKYGSHIRIITSLVFLVGMFFLFYQGFNLISDRKGVNLLLAFLVMVLLEMSFMLMLIYKNKIGEYPSMTQFLSTYSHLLYLAVFTIIVFLTFAIFNMQDASQTMMNMFYTIILGSLIFILIGYLGVINQIKDEKLTNVDIVKSIIPMKGIFNLAKEWKLVVGVPVEKFMDKFPQVNNSIVDKSIAI